MKYPGSNGKHPIREEIVSATTGRIAKVHTGPRPRCPHCDQEQVGGIFLMEGSRNCEHCGELFWYVECWSPDHNLVYKCYFLP